MIRLWVILRFDKSLQTRPIQERESDSGGFCYSLFLNVAQAVSVKETA